MGCSTPAAAWPVGLTMKQRSWVASVALPVDDIRRCATDPDFLAAVERLYQGLDARIARRNPRCLGRGDCCRFGAFEHRLFVTPAELACFMGICPGPIRPPGPGDACPYQVEGRCTARRARPAGCRVFFCDPASRSWQPVISEETIAHLKGLHRRYGLAYAYVDWMRALKRLAAD